MPDDFQGVSDIFLRPNDSDVPYSFTFNICSSYSANDGGIPYGLTVSSVSVTAESIDGDDVTEEMVGDTDVTEGYIVWVDLSYPSTNGDNVYHLIFVLTLSDDSTKDYIFERVYAVS